LDSITTESGASVEYPIADIDIGPRRRQLRDVDELAASIKAIGLLQPIVLTQAGRLVAGRHRLEAVKQLGWTKVPSILRSLTDLDAELAEIDENLIRNELTQLERSEHLARRKAIYEARHPETRHHVAGGKARQQAASDKMSFAADTATKTGVTRRTIERETRIAERIPEATRNLIRETPVADSQTDLLALAKVKDEAEQQRLASRVATGQAKNVREAVRQERYEGKVERSVEEAVTGRFPVLYADPPWSYQNSGFEMSAAGQYPTMPTPDIMALPIPDLVTTDAVLFLWATNPLLRDALRVMHAWGFTYKTNLVWVKDRPSAGFYVRGRHELLLVGVRGSFVPVAKPLPESVVTAPVTTHSAKPPEVYDLIERLYPGPYLELFARQRRDGWKAWGNEQGVQ
jgi:ParB/RepB/Spo0J family partition protein